MLWPVQAEPERDAPCHLRRPPKRHVPIKIGWRGCPRPIRLCLRSQKIQKSKCSCRLNQLKSGGKILLRTPICSNIQNPCGICRVAGVGYLPGKLSKQHYPMGTEFHPCEASSARNAPLVLNKCRGAAHHVIVIKAEKAATFLGEWLRKRRPGIRKSGGTALRLKMA